MNIAEGFIRRPVMTTLFMGAILLFGVIAYRALPVSDLPNVDRPTIQVYAGLPGASPETMSSAIATPLEKQFSTIAGIEAMTSTSSQGFTTISVQFELSRNIDAAAQDIQAAISTTMPLLPQNMPSPPTFQKVNPADQPILYMSVSSPTMPLSQVDEYAETFLSQRISMISGVAQVSVYGQQKYAVRVQVDPRALASRKIGIDEVSTAVQHGNVNLPTGTLYGAHKAFTLQANGQLVRADGYRQLIVAYRNGLPVRLGDLGVVADSVENDRIALWYNNEPSIVLAIQRQPGTNTVQVVDNIKKVLPVIRQQIPPSVSLTILYDRSESIRDSVADVKFSLFLAVCLVVLVIFLFLRNLSATLIPSVALPMSIIGTFAVMYLLNYTVDNLSLMALTLSVGFVVADAIVMLGDIVRHMEHGEGVRDAALKGSKEIGFTIVSMTLSLAAVFIPVLFMGGILGRLLHEFAVTIGAAILVSGFVSLTLTPMLCSRFLRPRHGEKHGRLFNAFERIHQGMLRAYDVSLQYALRHRLATMALSLFLVVATGYLFVKIPKGFLPSEDTGSIFIFTETVQGTSFDDLVRHQLQVMAILQQDPNVDATMSFLGGGQINQGRVFMQLKPRSQRDMSVDQLIRYFNRKLAGIPGIQVFLQNPPPIQIGGRRTKSLYQFTLQSPDPALYDYSTRLLTELQKLPILVNVTSDLQISNPQATVTINRDRAAALGVTAEQIEEALYNAYGSRQVSTIYTSTNQYWVVMELLPEYQRDLSALSLLYIRSRNGPLVPLASLATLGSSAGPLTVNHAGQLPSVTISFDLRDGVAIGTAVAQVQRVARQLLPASITTSFAGTAQAFQSSQAGLLFLLILAVLVIYMVLGVLYESFIHPLTVLSALPFAGFGALLTLLLFRMELSVYAFVGVIMLVGLVKKNGIMMIDFALEAQRTDGKSAHDAILQACSIRFRPIMMTTMAALMGTLPIALGVGVGSESRRPLGIAVVGGLAFSQFITLYVTPVIYTYLDALQQRLGRTWLGRAAPTHPQPEATPAD